MLEYPITFTDFNDVTRTEVLRFNLTKAEVADMEMSVTGSFSNMLKMLIEKQDIPAMSAIFKNLLLKSYGEKSLDGREFSKSKEMSDKFASTAAFSDIYMSLVTDADAAAKFINGILPEGLVKEMKKSAIDYPKTT